MGKAAGNGKIIIMNREVISPKEAITDRYGVVTYNCIWKTHRIIDIPSSAAFENYNSMSMNRDGRMAISSQGNSQVWIGKCLGVI